MGLLHLCLMAQATELLAASKGFLWGYNLGLSYDTTTRYAQISYMAPRPQGLPDQCEPALDDRTKMHCTAYLAPDGGSYSPSLYIEEPFVRQGLFYFEPGITASTLSYKGVLNTKPQRLEQGGSVGAKKAPTVIPEQPLQKATMELYGLSVQGTLTVGITPPILPDLFLSAGIGVQAVTGQVRVFTTTTPTLVFQPDGFVEAQVVFLRFGDGYAAFYLGHDQSLGSNFGGKLIEDYPSGTELKDFQLTLVGAASGVQLLFLW